MRNTYLSKINIYCIDELLDKKSKTKSMDAIKSALGEYNTEHVFLTNLEEDIFNVKLREEMKCSKQAIFVSTKTISLTERKISKFKTLDIVLKLYETKNVKIFTSDLNVIEYAKNKEIKYITFDGGQNGK